jgi:hypothetical protein
MSSLCCPSPHYSIVVQKLKILFQVTHNTFSYTDIVAFGNEWSTVRNVKLKIRYNQYCLKSYDPICFTKFKLKGKRGKRETSETSENVRQILIGQKNVRHVPCDKLRSNYLQ